MQRAQRQGEDWLPDQTRLRQESFSKPLMRSNGWTVTGKLRRDQPDIFTPEGRLHHLQDAIVQAVKEAMTRHEASAP